MSKLRVSISPAVAVPDAMPSLSLSIRYAREIPTDNNKVITAPAVGTFSLSKTLIGSFEIVDYSAPTPVDLEISTEQGTPLLISQGLAPTSPSESAGPFTIVRRLTSQEIESLSKSTTVSEPPTTRVLLRKGKFVTLGGSLSNPREYTFLVSAVERTAISSELLNSLFGIPEFGTTTKEVSSADRASLSRMQLGEVSQVLVKLQGDFEFSIPIDGDEAGWVWLLFNDKNTFVGIHAEKSLEPTLKSVTIFLPFSDTERDDSSPVPSGCSCDEARPIDATESELLNNPEKFSDDPGSFCKPFVNPNRIVGERAFSTILRVTQPAIGAESSYPRGETLPPFSFSTTFSTFDSEQPVITRDAPGSSARSLTRVDIARTASTLGLADVIGVARESVSIPAISNKAAIAERRPYLISKSQGRHDLSAKNPLDWEGDSSVYQAESLSFGHILDFRVRWRSNGYSLGNIAHTLTLAPRQTKKIVTVQSKILDKARRQEVTQSADTVEQETRRNYSYLDAVQSGLQEWAKGGSKSTSSSAAGGMGFALPGFVIGGGAATGSSQSSSWQEGGRNIAATEEQSLQDAIRQYGESLRKFESMVVVEQSQEEYVQAVSEIVRNPNYCHTLTVVYHEILRHLRIDTEVVGARECVFVPFAIKPFTVERALRWRDTLQKYIRKQEFRWALQYLDEVYTNFSSSDIPAGPRLDHPVTYVKGTIFLQLAIERPQDNPDGTFFFDAWNPITPYLGAPPEQIFGKLSRAEHAKDALFQKEYAPTIAARWVNSLVFESSAGYDFTLATKYNYNQIVQVDFSVTPRGTMTRRNLVDLVLKATQKLPRGSVANVKQVQIQYYTKSFNYRVSSPSLTDDLIETGTGNFENESALIHLEPTDWEEEDMRDVIRRAVSQLITHLNEHVEYYTSCGMWEINPDKAYMLLDSIYIRGKEDGRSVASVVERQPVAILGNSLVYRVTPGAFIGTGGHKSPADLNSYYVESSAHSEPIRVSLPTSGLYAQSLMDECEACEEHFGSTEWVLNDKEPDLAELTPDMLRRRADLPTTITPSQLPASIINLQNAPNVPPPTGLGDILNAIQNPNAFRDMAGLAGTQANASEAMKTAAGLASFFGGQAADLQKEAMRVKLAKEKLAIIDKEHKKGNIDDSAHSKETSATLAEMHPSQEYAQEEAASYSEAAKKAIADGKDVKAEKTDAITGTSEKIEVTSSGSAAAQSAWPSLDKKTVMDRIDELLKNPNKFNQTNLSLCVPALFYHHIFQLQTNKIWQFVNPLFTFGSGYLGKFKITAGITLRNANYKEYVTKHPGMPEQADWMLMASLRDSENHFWDVYDGSLEDDDLDTYMPDLAGWYRETGFYKKVTFLDMASDSVSVKETKVRSIQKSNTNHIGVCIKTQLINPASSGYHAIALEGPITIDDVNNTISFDYWTWGGPVQTLTKPKADVLKDLVSFVIADR